MDNTNLMLAIDYLKNEWSNLKIAIFNKIQKIKLFFKMKGLKK